MSALLVVCEWWGAAHSSHVYICSNWYLQSCREEVSPDYFRTWYCYTKCKNCGFLSCLFITTTTFITISTSLCLSDLYSHGCQCHSGFIFIHKIWELNYWVWSWLSPGFHINLLIFLRSFCNSCEECFAW